MEIELSQAKAIALEQQLYRHHVYVGKDGVLQLIKQLGYVQIDTISVVERAHHHTIWTRLEDYQHAYLGELLENDRQIYEHWGHALSYLPIEDYRFSLPKMHSFPRAGTWESEFLQKYRKEMKAILQRISAEGALGSKDFVDTRKDKPANGWGSEKPAKLALDILFWQGELMISRRHGFQRLYDLRERILPSETDTRMPSKRELHHHYILRSLQAMGLGTLNDIKTHFLTSESAHFAAALPELVESKGICELKVRGDKDAYYTLPHTLEHFSQRMHPHQMYLLSPFDNAVILRPRIKRLFGFDYTLECYTPPAKRQYGYWCLPMLYEGSFVGRIDCKAERKTKVLMVQALHWEKGIKLHDEMKEALLNGLYRFAIFCGCTSVGGAYE